MVKYNRLMVSKYHSKNSLTEAHYIEVHGILKYAIRQKLVYFLSDGSNPIETGSIPCSRQTESDNKFDTLIIIIIIIIIYLYGDVWANLASWFCCGGHKTQGGHNGYLREV